MTTKDLIRAHNDLAEQFGLPPLNGWKASKEALQARIDGLSAQVMTDPLAIIDPLALTEADKPTVTFETEENANPEADEEPSAVEPERCRRALPRRPRTSTVTRRSIRARSAS
jgi:hypothetical protein